MANGSVYSGSLWTAMASLRSWALIFNPACSAADALIWTTNTGFGCNTSITAAAVPASGITGTTLASGVVTTSITATGTMTNGTLGTGYVIARPTLTLGSDATGDIYYRNASGILTRLAIGSTGNLLGVSGGLPAWTSLPSAILMGTPGNPTGTTSTTAVMMGIGTTCKITPTVTGRVRITLIGLMTTTVGSDGVQAQLAYGTGTAPANAAAATGTTLGVPTDYFGVPSTPFTLPGVISSLTLGTQIWIDLQVKVPITGATGTITSITCEAEEI